MNSKQDKLDAQMKELKQVIAELIKEMDPEAEAEFIKQMFGDYHTFERLLGRNSDEQM